MAHAITIDSHLSKQAKYDALLPQIEALVAGENDLVANLANIVSALKYGMDWFWVGIYFVKDSAATSIITNPIGSNLIQKELVLGPFQGPVACTRIAFGKGVCGTAWKNKTVIIVEDVDAFPGHIACNSLSKSEIVLPVFRNNEVEMVLDIDSAVYADFDEVDKNRLLKVTSLIEQLIRN